MVYRDRRHAGRELAGLLKHLENQPDVVVLALPRGGVPVAYEVACAIKAPLDVFLVRKLGVPDQPELAMGAIATGGVRVINDDLVRALRIPASTIEAVAAAEGAELDRRERLYRAGHQGIALRNRTVVLVDDGLATGSTMKAAVQAVRADAPARVVVAVPVGAAETCVALAAIADGPLARYRVAANPRLQTPRDPSAIHAAKKVLYVNAQEMRVQKMRSHGLDVPARP